MQQQQERKKKKTKYYPHTYKNLKKTEALMVSYDYIYTIIELNTLFTH